MTGETAENTPTQGNGDDRSITPVEAPAREQTVNSDMSRKDETTPPPSYDEISAYNTAGKDVEVAVENDSNKPENGHAKKDNNGAPMSFENPAYDEDKPVKASTSDKDGNEEEKKKEDEKVEMVSVKELFRYADCLDIFLMITGTLCACGHGAALPALMIVFGDMTDSFIGASTANVTSTASPVDPLATMLDEMETFAIYYIIIACCVLVLGYGQVTCWLITSYRQTFKIRNELFKGILKQDIGWFDTHEPGELNTRLTDDVNKIQEGIGDKIGNFWQWFATFLAGIIIGFVYGWKLSLVILAVGPLLAICGGLFGKLTTAFTSKELAAYAKAGAVAEEVLIGIRTVFAFSGQEKEVKRYANNLDEAKNFGIKKASISGGSMGAVFFIIFCTYALAFWYGSKLTREDPNYTAGTMLIVFFCVLIGAFALGNAGPNIGNVATARGAAFTIWHLIDRVPPIDSSSDEGKKPPSCEGNIEFKDVVFKYPSRPDVPILNGLTVKVDVGQTVAFVGSSGCGKSTSVQLIQRFYDTLGGCVMIDGNDIKSLNVKWLRDHIGVVSQEPILFATSIEENIRYGRDGVTDEEIKQACREANAYDFISNLPKKLQTLVGERGAQLSGGQKQRIAIARALVRNPKILLLDEATSALDFESEATVQAALDKARAGRTTIVIAHRLSTVRTADIIVGLKNGVVEEAGTHDELMSRKGIYYTLCTNQSQVESEAADMFDDDNTHGGKRGYGAAADTDVQLERENSFKRRDSKLKRATSTVGKGGDSKDEEKLPDPPMSRILKMNSPEILYIIFGCISSIIVGGVQPMFAIVFSEILGIFVEPIDEQIKQARFYSLMFVVIGIVAGISMFFQAYLFGVSGERLTKRIRELAFKSFLKQDMSYFDDHKNNVGALTTRLATDASAVQGATGARFGQAFQSFASVGVGIIIGFAYSWKLTLGVLAFVPFILLAGLLQMKLMQGYSTEGREALEGAGKVAIEAIENMRTVAQLCREKTFIDKYYNHLHGPHKHAVRKAHLSGIAFSFTQSIIFFAYAASFYLGAYLIKNDGLTFENMFKVFSAIVFGAMALGQASHFAPDYGKAKSAAARLFQLFDREPLIDNANQEGLKLDNINGNVSFCSTEFHYPSRPSVQVLQGLEFDVAPGQQVALVGSSGCGKSTTIQLLERFYDPIGGAVKLDGHDLKDVNVGWLRSQLGLVSQEPILFDCSIRENIAYGDNSREVSMDEIIAAARKSNIHNFIDSLPQGYETSAGDKGAQLSGGQKQRIAIARALVRNPKILLLDEATSALDTESEKVVQEALEKAQEGRTSIVIAHRLSTIQNADVIFVFNKGKVAEKGTHSDLMAQKGLYYKLQRTQARK